MARWIGSTRKNSTCAATTSGRRTRRTLPICRRTRPHVPQYPITDWIPTHAHGGCAALSAARRPQSRGARGRGERQGRQDRVDQSAHSTGSGLHSALRLARPQNTVDRNPHVAITSIAHCILPMPKTASRTRCSRSATTSLSTRTTTSAVGDGVIVLTQWSDGHNHLYLYSYNQAQSWRAPPSWSGNSPAAISKWATCTGRLRAQAGRLRIERRQSAGAADVAGELRRRAQAVERRRGFS